MKQKDIDNILKANKKLDWVKRLYEKDTPSIVLPGQEYPSTHYMESSDNLVYPTIIRNADGKLEYLGNKARDYAIKTNTAIKLSSEEDANWFGENYKKGTNVLKQFKKGGKITAETIYSMNKQPKVILTPNDIYAKDGANIDLSNTTGDRKVFSLDEFKNIVPDYQYQGYLNSGKEGLYKNINKLKYPVQIDTLPDGSVTYRPYSYESAETSYEDYKKLSQNNQPIKATPITGFKDGGIVQAWVQKFTNGGMAVQQNYLDLNRINNENMEKAGQTSSSGSAGGGMMGSSGMMGGGGMDMFSGMFKAMKQSIDNKKLEGRNKKQKEVNLHNATINPYINSYQQFDDPNQMSQSDNQINNSTPEMTWDNEEGDNTATKSKFDSFTMQMGKPGTAGAMLDQIGDMAYASSQQASQAMNMMGGQSGGGQGGGMDMSQMMSMFKKKYGGYVADGGYNASYMDFMNTNQSLKGQLPSYLSNAQVNTNQISSQNYLNNVTPMQTKGTQSLTNNTTQRVSATPNKSMMGADGKQASGATPKGNGLTSSIGGVFSKVDEGVQSLYDGVGAMTDADSGAGAWFQGGAKAGQIAGKYTEGLKNIPVYGEIIAAAIDSVARFTGGALNVRDRQEYNKMKDRQDKVDEYKSRQAPLVYDPNKKGQYMAKYGANPKMMEQRIIDDIYSDFDKYMKKV